MGKHKGVYWTLLLALVFALGFVPDKAQGVELLNGDLKIGGKLENYTGVRMQERVFLDGMGSEDAKLKQGQLERMRNTMQVEMEWRMSPDAVLHAIGRADYDAKYSLDSDIPGARDTDHRRSFPDGDNLEFNAAMREFYIKYNPGNFTITAGRQQIVWGESDNLRMSDIINPLDLSWSGGLVGWEDIRIPQWMLDVKYTVPESAYNLTGELVWNPFDFQPTRFAPYGDTYYPFGGITDGLPNVPIFAPASFVLARDALFGAFEDARYRGNGTKSFKNGAVGGRVGTRLGDFQFYLQDYYQPTSSPVLTFNPNPFDSRLGFHVEFPYINTIGGTFSYDSKFLKTVFRGEFGYVTDEPFSSPGPFGTIGLVEKDTFSYMLGFDHSAMIPLLNPNTSIFISGQIFQKYIMQSDETLITQFGEDGSSNHMSIMTLLLSTAYWYDKIKPQVVYVQDLQWMSGMLNPEIAYQPVFEWSFALGYTYIWGKTYQGPFSSWKDNDELYVKIAYKF